MSTYQQIELDTRPAEEAGRRMGQRMMRGVQKGFDGKTLGEKIVSEITSQARGAVWTVDQLYKALNSSIRSHGSARKVHRSLVDESLQTLERDYKQAQMNGPADLGKLAKKMIARIGELQGDMLQAVVDDSIEKTQQQLKKQANTIGSVKEQTALRGGLSNQAANRAREKGMSAYVSRVDNAVVRNEDGSINNAATRANLSAIASDVDRQVKTNRRLAAVAKDQKAAEKKHQAELRAEEAEIRKVTQLQDQYLKRDGMGRVEREIYAESTRKSLEDNRSKIHADNIKAYKTEATALKASLDMQDKEIARAKERDAAQKKAWQHAEKFWNGEKKRLSMHGYTESQLALLRDLFEGQMQLKIGNVKDMAGANSFKNELKQAYYPQMLKGLEAERKHGFVPQRADLKTYVGDVLSAVKRADILSGMSTDAANEKKRAAKMGFRQRVREANDTADLDKIRADLDQMHAQAQSTIETKQAARSVKKYRQAVMDEADDLIRMHKDRQRMKNKWSVLPHINSAFSNTPFLPFGALKHIPMFARAGHGESLEEERDDIRRQLRAAKTREEVDAIRRRYQFDERNRAYTTDLKKYRNREARWYNPLSYQIRSGDGQYIPTLNKMGDNLMRFTNRLATAWIAVMWGRMFMQSIGAPAAGLMQSADAYTRQKNMYNVTIPNTMTGDKSYERWEDESFERARRLRMGAKEYREMVINAAPIFHTAEYGEDYKTGKVGADGKIHKQGERIVTSMEQVDRVASALHMMAKISGSTDVEMHAAMRQIIQMVSKGRGNIQDIRPILETGGHMGDMIARFGFGAKGAADLYKLNDAKALTADRLLTNLLSDKVNDDLREMMRRSARTWEEVAAMMKSDLGRVMLPTVRAFAQESEYGLGDKLLAITKQIGENKWLAEGIRNKVDEAITAMQNNWQVHIGKVLRMMSMLAGLFGFGVGIAATMNRAMNQLVRFGYSRDTTSHIETVMKNSSLASEMNDWAMNDVPGLLNKHVFGSASHTPASGLATGSIMPSTNNKLLRDYLARNGVDIETLSGMSMTGYITQEYARESTKALKLLSGLNGMSTSDMLKEVTGGEGYVNNRRTVYGKLITGGDDLDDLQKSIAIANELVNKRDVYDTLMGFVDASRAVDSSDDSLSSIAQFFRESSIKMFKAGDSGIQKLMDELTNTQKQFEDERLPGKPLNHLANTDQNTKKTEENTRKATAIQLAILKQVAGTRTINRVVHVSPNIVSNVGTIRNGIEYDQLLKDLGSTVNHAVTAYAL